jgi:hypothetical protein
MVAAERAIATFIEIALLTSLGALIAKALPPPLELDTKKTKKEKKRVLMKKRNAPQTHPTRRKSDDGGDGANNRERPERKE